MQNIKKLRRRYTSQFFKGNGIYLLLCMIQTVTVVAANLFIAWLMQQLIDTAIGSSSDFALWQIALISIPGLGLWLLAAGLDYVSIPKFNAKSMQQYKEYVFKELAKKSISAFSGENTALYLSALSNDANEIQSGYLANIFPLICDIMLFIGAITMMLWYSPMLTAVAVVAALLPVLVSLLAGDHMAIAETKLSQRNESLTATLKDSLTGFSVIKSFRAEKVICHQFSDCVKAVADAKCDLDRIVVILYSASNIAGVLAQFSVFFVGGWLAFTGRGVSAGIVMSFVQMMNYIINPIGRVPAILAKRKAAFALIDKLVLALNENVRDEGEHIPKALNEGIRLENLTFSYDGEKKALENVTVSFEAGKSYAIVGGSGSGKSTLLNLLMAGYSDYDGSILYDGKELRSISSESIYDLVSLIQQNVFIFNNTVRNNVTMFHPFDDQDVNKAMDLSGLSEFIAKRGAEAKCGENGCNLSGGEKQRISIARSLLRKSPVLLMDEATASLDTQTAYRVISSILALNGLTRIVVTHSLDASILECYDKIIAMKNGSIIESGTFEELMEKKGYFYSLYTVSQ